MAQKLTRAFLDRKYDELYKRTKTMLAALKPCNIRHNIFDDVVCNGTSMGCTMNAIPNKLCCNAFADEPTCQYLSKKGCTVKSLRCALWICDEVIMAPLKSGIPDQVITSMGPTEAHPNRNYICGLAVFPMISQVHLDIFNEAKRYRFLRFFRQGKVVAVNYAYATRDRIQVEEIKSEALTPDEYALSEFSEGNHFVVHTVKN